MRGMNGEVASTFHSKGNIRIKHCRIAGINFADADIIYDDTLTDNDR